MSIVKYESKDRIAVITLNRPEKRNALNGAMFEELCQAWLRFQASDDRVAVLCAEGGHFCSGVDIVDVPRDMWKGMPNVGVKLEKPLISAVQGWSIGSGFTLVMMSDLCVAERGAQFSFPEGRVGVFGGITAGLVARIPQKVAVEFLMLGNAMSAERAYEVGLVNRLAEPGELMDRTFEYAEQLAACAPLVLRAIKRWTLETLPKAPAESFYPDMGMVLEMAASEDFKEGASAFKAKRAPMFSGK